MNWRDEAACRESDPALFFPSGVKGPKATELTREALAVCASCPVRAECRTYALQHEEWGIWGGMSEQELRETKGRCGTAAGYSRHRRDTTEPCQPCMAAHAKWRREKAERERGAA